MVIKQAPLRKPRFRIIAADCGEHIEVPAAVQWFALPFLMVWLTGWTVGGVAAITELLTQFSLFLAVWLSFWLLVWLFIASSVLWQLKGREVISVVGGQLVHGCRAPFWNRKLGYPVTEISDLAADRGMNFFERWHYATPLFTFGRMGAVKFNYGPRTIRMCASLDEAEGVQIVERLSKRLPNSALNPAYRR